MMLGLGGLRNPLIIGQMMGATISAESHESDYGGLMPSHNHYGDSRRIGMDFATEFLARNWDGVDVIKLNLVRSHSKANDYVVAERRRDALASCCPSNQLARNLVILRKVEFVARRSNCGVLERRAISSSLRA
ncbi:MAG TPA: hypothetical protein VIE65_04015 [Methylobacter sp.]|jgi:hypothetical protein